MSGISICTSIRTRRKHTHHLSQRLKEVEAENSQLYAMKRDFRRVWNYFGAEKMQQVIGLMRGAGADRG